MNAQTDWRRVSGYERYKPEPLAAQAMRDLIAVVDLSATDMQARAELNRHFVDEVPLIQCELVAQVEGRRIHGFFLSPALARFLPAPSSATVVLQIHGGFGGSEK